MTRNNFTDNTQFSAAAWNAMVNAHNLEAVKTGCAPSKGTGNWDVDITSGTTINGTSTGEVVVGSQTVTLDAADASLNRVDIITIDTLGNAQAVKGTAASDPVAPDIPANQVLVCAVELTAGASSISTADIHDYRVFYYGDYPLDDSDINDGSGSSLDADTVDGFEAAAIPPGGDCSNLANTEDAWIQNTSGAAEIHYIGVWLKQHRSDTMAIYINDTNSFDGNEFMVHDLETGGNSGSPSRGVWSTTTILPKDWYIYVEVISSESATDPFIKQWVSQSFF